MQIKIDNIIKESPIEAAEAPDERDHLDELVKLKLLGRSSGRPAEEALQTNGWRAKRRTGRKSAKAAANGDANLKTDENSAARPKMAAPNSNSNNNNNNNTILNKDNLRLVQRAKKAIAELNKGAQHGERLQDERAAAESETPAPPKAADQSEPVAGVAEPGPADEFRAEIVWFNIFLFVVLHSALPVGVYKLLTEWPLRTLLWSFFCIYASGLGVTGGAHRLWSHRAYKASLPVEVLLMLLQTMAGQNSVYTWSRDHRLHHKFSETHADPHNIKRGFFFAHMGWLCCRKHPDVKEKGRLIDMSDLEANSVVMFQHRHFWWLSVLCNVAAPMAVPIYLWGESYSTAFVFPFMVRYLITLHGTWLVNSAAHYHGSRPYDKRIEARESPLVIATALGEGFHNYHHTFPYDYSTSEFGKYLNITTAFIDLCASLGLTYDLRKVDPEVIRRRQVRTGDTRGKLAAAATEAVAAAALAAAALEAKVPEDLGGSISKEHGDAAGADDYDELDEHELIIRSSGASQSNSAGPAKAPARDSGSQTVSVKYTM